jgi:hypothetical protein
MDKIEKLERTIKILQAKLNHYKLTQTLHTYEKSIKNLKSWKFEKTSYGEFLFYKNGVFGKEHCRIVSEMEKDEFLANKNALIETCKRYYSTRRF